MIENVAHVKEHSAGGNVSQLDWLCRSLAGFIFNGYGQEINTESSDELDSSLRAARNRNRSYKWRVISGRPADDSTV